MVELGRRQEVRGEIHSVDAIFFGEGLDEEFGGRTNRAANVHYSPSVLRCGSQFAVVVVDVLLNR